MSEKKMRVLSVINLKGGVAKTISSVAIAVSYTHLLRHENRRGKDPGNEQKGEDGQ